jgi:hypothetical protein
MTHIHKFYISVDYGGRFEGLCEDETCMEFIPPAEINKMLNRLAALEQMAEKQNAAIKKYVKAFTKKADKEGWDALIATLAEYKSLNIAT